MANDWSDCGFEKSINKIYHSSFGSSRFDATYEHSDLSNIHLDDYNRISFP